MQTKIAIIIVLMCSLSGCVGTAIETATDTAIAVAKIPFKVGAAAADVIAGDDEEEE